MNCCMEQYSTYRTRPKDISIANGEHTMQHFKYVAHDSGLKNVLVCRLKKNNNTTKQPTTTTKMNEKMRGTFTLSYVAQTTYIAYVYAWES